LEPIERHVGEGESPGRSSIACANHREVAAAEVLAQPAEAKQPLPSQIGAQDVQNADAAGRTRRAANGPGIPDAGTNRGGAVLLRSGKNLLVDNGRRAGFRGVIRARRSALRCVRRSYLTEGRAAQRKHRPRSDEMKAHSKTGSVEQYSPETSAK